MKLSGSGWDIGFKGKLLPGNNGRRTGTVTPLGTVLWAGDGFISSAVLMGVFRKPKPVIGESADEPCPLAGCPLMA